MPRKDPMTGCKVMTNGEFWASEGERAGTSADVEMAKFWKELENEQEAQRKLYEHPPYALEFINRVIRGWQDEDNPESWIPESVVWVAEAAYFGTLGGEFARILAEVRRGNELRWILVWDSQTFPSYWEPGDADGGYCWIPLIGVER